MNADDLLKDAKQLFKDVCKTFNKTEEEVNEDVETVRKWIQTQHHLPEVMRDSHVRNFLIMNKFRIETTKQKIDMYYTIRSLIPDFDYCNPKSPRMQAVFKDAFSGMHPKLAQNLYRVHFGKLRGPNSIYLPLETMLMTCNCGEIRLYEDCFFYDIIVVDLVYSKLGDLAKITPSFIMKASAIYEKVFSFRLKAAYFINAPSYFSTTAEVLKRFIKPKIFERILICKDAEILKQLFTIDDLPKDYGGHGPSLQDITDILEKKMEKYQSRFDELDGLRVDESLRPEKLIDDEILGFYGNFKQLNIE